MGLVHKIYEKFWELKSRSEDYKKEKKKVEKNTLGFAIQLFKYSSTRDPQKTALLAYKPSNDIYLLTGKFYF